MNPEAQAIHDAIQSLDDRITGLQGELVSRTLKPLSDDEAEWVRLAIKREAQSIKLRQAVIEKTLAGLVWAAVVGLGYVALDYLKAHGWKP